MWKQSAIYVGRFWGVIGLLFICAYLPLAKWGSPTLALVLVYIAFPLCCIAGWFIWQRHERSSAIRKAKIVAASLLMASALYIALAVVIQTNHLKLAGIVTVLWLFTLYVIEVRSLRKKGEEPREKHIRGRSLLTFARAKELAAALQKDGEEGVFWGGLWLPIEVATSHFCVVGATGSGKTLTLRLLMQSVLPRIANSGDTRALVYDAKMDALPYLVGMGIAEERIVNLNPFDERGAAWDMAADITSPVSALQLATILIPDDRSTKQPFFPNAARELLTAVVMALIHVKPGTWTFRDVILTACSMEELRELVSRTPYTSGVLEYFKNDKTASDILSTLREKLSTYRFIAAAWSRAERKISLKEWLESDSILLLGNDEAMRSAVDSVNRLMFKRIGELVLAQRESETRRTWIFLDEVREAGKLEGLAALATKGRSKGVCLVLGLQDIEGLREVYNPYVAQEILGQCSNKAILRLENPGTAEWAAKLFGTREALEERKSRSENKGGGPSSGASEQVVERPVVLASQLVMCQLRIRKTG